MGIFQPIGQKRLTNVAVVKYKKGGKRFEIACYRNKVQEWRTGIEKDLDEVLQSTTVFENVSKAKHANYKDLQAVFGITDQMKICIEILQKGELQISDKERDQELGSQFQDVVNNIVEKCVNPQNNLPYTQGMIEKGLRRAGFSVDPKRSAKQQALEAIPVLQESFPIERAKMRVKVSVPLDSKDQLHDVLKHYQPIIEFDEIVNELYVVLAQADPGIYREVNNLFSKQLRGKGQMEVLAFAVQGENTQGSQGISLQQNPVHKDFSKQLQIQNNQVNPIQNKDSSCEGRNKFIDGNQSKNDSQIDNKADNQQEQVKKDTKQINKHTQGNKETVYLKGPIKDIPEEYQRRKEMFQEIDNIQQGWTVELHKEQNSNFVEAVFYNPQDILVGPYNKARTQAISNQKINDQI